MYCVTVYYDIVILFLVFFFFFKQKTAYEMLRSLVGSEMCIRDRVSVVNSKMPLTRVMWLKCALLLCCVFHFNVCEVFAIFAIFTRKLKEQTRGSLLAYRSCERKTQPQQTSNRAHLKIGTMWDVGLKRVLFCFEHAL
eukprot:TRINITY_DN13585_c0_g1_i12.p1 TRINITY_DN13585_c0_g1~~TRINITY_DN13585_c0_g1_i12.p1  ORF type:complete len:138 (+),score=8.79 TRINITY_DN13585_c0_g1_i12:79-492(+)